MRGVIKECLVFNLVAETDVVKIALPQYSATKARPCYAPKTVLLYSLIHAWYPKVALNFGNDGCHCREKRCDIHLLAISSVYRFTSLCENKEVLPDMVEVLQVLSYFNII